MPKGTGYRSRDRLRPEPEPKRVAHDRGGIHFVPVTVIGAYCPLDLPPELRGSVVRSARNSPRRANGMAEAYKVLGSTTDVTDCGLCGRTDLQGTIALQPLDPNGNADGDVVYYGSDCGATAAGWTQREIRQQARSADDARRREEQAGRNAEHKAAYASWSSWLTAQTGETEITAAVQQLGGFAAARALYREAMAA